MWLWAAKGGSVGKRPLPERKSREAINASLMADASMEDDIGELVTQAAVDEARTIMRKPIGAPPPLPPTPALPPPPPSTPIAKTRYHIRNWKADCQALVQRGGLMLWFDQSVFVYNKLGKKARRYLLWPGF